MFDVWMGDVELTTLVLLFSLAVLFPGQLLLCLPLTTGARTVPPAYSRKMAGSLSFFPVIPSPWAGNGSLLGWIRTAARNWTICSRNGRWNGLLHAPASL